MCELRLDLLETVGLIDDSSAELDTAQPTGGLILKSTPLFQKLSQLLPPYAV